MSSVLYEALCEESNVLQYQVSRPVLLFSLMTQCVSRDPWKSERLRILVLTCLESDPSPSCLSFPSFPSSME